MTLHPIRMMTWNVYGTSLLNPHFDIEGVIALIHKWNPDIVALQEIDSRGQTADPFARIQAALGGSSISARSIVTADGDYGQMVISRWPWLQTPAITDISFGEREPRRAISALVATPQGPLQVIATHLGLSIRERRRQAYTLLDLAAAAADPVLMLGDFNDWFWINSVRGTLARQFPIRSRNRTFPSRLPLMRLDRVYGRGIRIVQARVDSTARALSDHLPLIADITLMPATTPFAVANALPIPGG